MFSAGRLLYFQTQANISTGRNLHQPAFFKLKLFFTKTADSSSRPKTRIMYVFVSKHSGM
jgi:hypothetical protein